MGSEQSRLLAEHELAIELAKNIEAGLTTSSKIYKGPLPDGTRKLLFAGNGSYIGARLLAEQ
jgi:hypothetical protein